MSLRSTRTDIHAHIEGTCREGLREIPALTLAYLRSMPSAFDAARVWLNADRADQVAVAIERLEEQGVFSYDTPNVQSKIDAITARCQRTIEASGQPTSSLDHTETLTSSTSSSSNESEPRMETLSIDPSILTGLRIVLCAQHPGPQFARALDKAIVQLVEKGLPFTFDVATHTLYLPSESEPGVVRATDGSTCDCPGARHPHHWHTAAWSLVVVAMALVDPYGLFAPPAPAWEEEEAAFA